MCCKLLPSHSFRYSSHGWPFLGPPGPKPRGQGEIPWKETSIRSSHPVRNTAHFERYNTDFSSWSSHSLSEHTLQHHINTNSTFWPPMQDLVNTPGWTGVESENHMSRNCSWWERTWRHCCSLESLWRCVCCSFLFRERGFRRAVEERFTFEINEREFPVSASIRHDLLSV